QAHCEGERGNLLDERLVAGLLAAAPIGCRSGDDNLVVTAAREHRTQHREHCLELAGGLRFGAVEAGRADAAPGSSAHTPDSARCDTRSLSQATQLAMPSPVSAETRSNFALEFCRRKRATQASTSNGTCGRRSILVRTTRSAARKACGYFS